MTTEVCRHDRQRRQCDECDMAEEIESLRAEVARLKSDRRDRIATAVLGHLYADRELAPTWRGENSTLTFAEFVAAEAVSLADALIAELDKEPSR